MSAITFDERLQRISQTQAATRPMAEPKKKRVKLGAERADSAGGGGLLKHPVAMALGGVAGFIAGLMIVGVTTQGSPWGPGGDLADIVGIPAMLMGALGPLMLLVSLLKRKSRPAFFQFSMAYFVALIVSVVI